MLVEQIAPSVEQKANTLPTALRKELLRTLGSISYDDSPAKIVLKLKQSTRFPESRQKGDSVIICSTCGYREGFLVRSLHQVLSS
jgi:hypothetical protein